MLQASQFGRLHVPRTLSKFRTRRINRLEVLQRRPDDILDDVFQLRRGAQGPHDNAEHVLSVMQEQLSESLLVPLLHSSYQWVR